MRIIAGSKARMVLLSPRGQTTRPITDRVKESLFAILNPILKDVTVADLFCGTGSLGLEALSRGAYHAIMVDNERDAIKRLKKNIAKLNFENQTTVIQTDAFKYNISGTNESIDAARDNEVACKVIFIDPPYQLSRETSLDSPLGALLARLSEQIAQRGIVVVRHEHRVELLPTYLHLHLQDRREYGSMAITFLEKVVG